MNGRQERHNIINTRVLDYIKDKGDILNNYYYYFGDKSENTRRVYIETAEEFIKFISNKSLEEIKPSDINKYLDYKKEKIVNGKKVECTNGYRATKYYALSHFFKFLLADGYVKSNPCEDVEPPKSAYEKEIVALTPDEISKIKNNIIRGTGSKRSLTEHKKWVNRDLAILTLGCSTGLRVSSITEINIEDIDFNNNTISVIEKGNKHRTIIFGDNTKKILLNWIKDRNEMFEDIGTDALFISRKRNRMSNQAVADMLKKFSEGIDKRITPHKMRSSCATNLYEQTGDIYLVADVLGHKNLANTRRYARISEERRIKAANILDNLT